MGPGLEAGRRLGRFEISFSMGTLVSTSTLSTPSLRTACHGRFFCQQVCSRMEQARVLLPFCRLLLPLLVVCFFFGLQFLVSSRYLLAVCGAGRTFRLFSCLLRAGGLYVAPTASTPSENSSLAVDAVHASFLPQSQAGPGKARSRPLTVSLSLSCRITCADSRACRCSATAI